MLLTFWPSFPSNFLWFCVCWDNIILYKNVKQQQPHTEKEMILKILLGQLVNCWLMGKTKQNTAEVTSTGNGKPGIFLTESNETLYIFLFAFISEQKGGNVDNHEPRSGQQWIQAVWSINLALLWSSMCVAQLRQQRMQGEAFCP